MNEDRTVGRAWAVADLLLAVAIAGMATVYGLATWLVRRSVRPPGQRELLVLDAAYTLLTARARGIERSFMARDLDGYFAHVWSVHPLVGADPSQEPAERFGGVETTALTDRHTVVEAGVARWRPLRRLPMANFLLAQLGLLRCLERLCRTRPIVAVRAGDPYYLGLIGWLLSRRHGVPLVVRVNGNYDEIFAALGRPAYPRLFRTRAVEKRIDRFVLSRAEFVAGANRNNLAFALDNGARPDRAAVFPYGNLIAAAHFTEPSERAGDLPEVLRGRRYLCYVGRLEPVKYPQDVVAALTLLRDAHPDLDAVLVGDGSMAGQLAESAAREGLRERVLLPGAWDQRAIAAAMAHAEVIVAPHMGRALVEAALSGRPIVAYDNEWHAEFVRDGETGRLTAFRDVQALAAAIDELLRDQPQAQRLSNAARASALRDMSPAELSRRERDVYERLAERAS